MTNSWADTLARLATAKGKVALSDVVITTLPLSSINTSVVVQMDIDEKTWMTVILNYFLMVLKILAAYFTIVNR